MKRRRGRPPVIPPEVIAEARGSLARGVDVATVARTYGLSRRYVRDLASERPLARPDAELPFDLRDLLGADADLATLASQITRAVESRSAAAPPAPPRTLEDERRELAEFFRGLGAAIAGR